MTLKEFKQLPAEEQARFHTTRKCPECDSPLVGDGHSTGLLHVICPECERCPDCDDGE